MGSTPSLMTLVKGISLREFALDMRKIKSDDLEPPWVGTTDSERLVPCRSQVGGMPWLE